MSEVKEITSLPLAATAVNLLMIGVQDGTLKSVSNPFAVVQRVASTQDLNTFLTPGLFSLEKLMEHRPKDVNTVGALLWVWSHSAGYVWQFLWALMWDGGSGFYYRFVRPNADWCLWRKMTGASVEYQT